MPPAVGKGVLRKTPEEVYAEVGSLPSSLLFLHLLAYRYRRRATCSRTTPGSRHQAKRRTHSLATRSGSVSAFTLIFPVSFSLSATSQAPPHAILVRCCGDGLGRAKGDRRCQGRCEMSCVKWWKELRETPSSRGNGNVFER